MRASSDKKRPNFFTKCFRFSGTRKDSWMVMLLIDEGGERGGRMACVQRTDSDPISMMACLGCIIRVNKARRELKMTFQSVG